MEPYSTTRTIDMTLNNPSPRSLNRRTMIIATAAAGASVAAPWAHAQAAFPDHPLRLLVPFPAGGPTDIVARPLAQFLSEPLKQQVIIDNRGGAGGAIAAEMVAKAQADGYTLLMGTVGTHAINQALYKKLPYDPMRDFTPLGLVASGPVALVVNQSAPFADAAALIAAAKAKPDGVTYGSAGNGTPGHLTGELFSKAAGISLRHVPYRGSAPAVTDLLGNQIAVMFDPLQSVLSHVQAGKLRVLAISGRERSPLLPSVPTMVQAGLRDLVAEAWWAVYAPAQLPAPIAEKLTAAVEQVVKSVQFREKLSGYGLQPTSMHGEAFAKFSRAEAERWGKAVRDSGASLD
jgi:tripartite-type tricarboxylate transporter receptor subunit TctC